MTETSPERLRGIFDALPNLVLLLDMSDGMIEDVGSDGAAMLGYAVDDLRSRRARELVHPADHGRLVESRASVIGGQEQRFEIRVLDASGEPHSYLLTQKRFDDHRVLVTGKPSASVTNSDSVFSDLMKLAGLTDDIFMVTNRNGIISYVNGAISAAIGERVILGEHISGFVDIASWVPIATRIRNGETRLQARVLATHVDGTSTPFELRSSFDAESQQWYTVLRNIDALVESENWMARLNERLRRQATTDPLTGVANRIAFSEAVELAIESHEPFSILLLDMDDFKSVNDTLGHGVGDDFLRVLARRLQSTVALQDLVARLGGDEFVIYVPELGSNDAAGLAARILEAISAPFQIGGHSLSRSCSIGGATWVPGEGFSDVLRKADQAAYQAKHAGRSRFAMHEGVSNGYPAEATQQVVSPVKRF